ncbi:MAG: cyclic pyranopterin monophosphate synthase MoaC [Candidatus Eremiobacteraeota bacterium]|nr:cyclic pyranopterin monophosphate synthase MoaC [Candidatus Eremiobacteraeota bacterium]
MTTSRRRTTPLVPGSPHRRRTGLSHMTRDGSVAMVDVGAKAVTARTAIAEADVVMSAKARALIRAGTAKKGDVLITAQIAGMLAAKRTAQLIPLCHPIAISHIDVRCEPRGDDRIRVRCAVASEGRTGAEMEALTGCAVAALTIYDMVKAADRSMTIERLLLVEKTGGKSGHYRRGKL